MDFQEVVQDLDLHSAQKDVLPSSCSVSLLRQCNFNGLFGVRVSGNTRSNSHLSSALAVSQVWMAFIPTTFGLWFDDWNVKGFLMRERAYLYAEKFRDPQARGTVFGEDPGVSRALSIPCT